MSPIIKQQKGEHKNLIQDLLSQGFIRARIDNKIMRLNQNIKLIKTKKHSIDIVIDRLIISDGVFSKGKSLISNNKISPSYNNSIAIRGNISRESLGNLNEKNISLFLGANFHYVLYPLSEDKDYFNFIGVLEYKLTVNEYDNYELSNEEPFIQIIKDKLQNKVSAKILGLA